MSAEAYEDRQEEFEMQIPPGKHLGELVIDMEKVSKGYGDRLLIDDLSLRLPAGGIVGIIGPNGARQDNVVSHAGRRGKARHRYGARRADG